MNDNYTSQFQTIEATVKWIQEYDSQLIASTPLIKDFLSPLFINEVLLNTIGEQPTIFAKRNNNDNEKQEADHCYSDYYKKLIDWLKLLFKGNETVEYHLGLIKPVILDDYISTVTSNIQPDNNKDLNDVNNNADDDTGKTKPLQFNTLPKNSIELSVEQLELFDQIYYLCCLLLVTGVRGRRMAWAMTNINYLPIAYKRSLERFNLIADKLNDENRTTNSDDGGNKEVDDDDDIGRLKWLLAEKDQKLDELLKLNDELKTETISKNENLISLINSLTLKNNELNRLNDENISKIQNLENTVDLLNAKINKLQFLDSTGLGTNSESSMELSMLKFEGKVMEEFVRLIVSGGGGGLPYI